MPEITLGNVAEPPPEDLEAPQNVERPEIVEEAPAEEAPAEVEEESVMPGDVESAPVVAKKPRGRPKGPPKPKPEPKKRGRPPMPPATALGVESNPEPRPSYEAPVAWDMTAYNQSLINALVAHSQTTKVQRRAQWSSLVNL